jgi:hypothetical protein
MEVMRDPVITADEQTSVGGGGAETDTGAEAGSGSGEGDNVFQSMDAECTVCMQESKVRQHQVMYSVDDLYFDYNTLIILMVSQHAVAFVYDVWAPVCV